MIDEISAIEFEEQIFQMALHGVEQKELKKLRHQFYNEAAKDTKIPLVEFQNMGLRLGKPNTTKVIRE